MMRDNEQIYQQVFQLTANTNVRILTDVHGAVVDIQIQASAAERHKFLLNFEEKSRHFSTACSTYIVQSELTKFRRKYGTQNNNIQKLLDEVQVISEKFAKLEALINQVDQSDHAKNLNELKILTHEIHEYLYGTTFTLISTHTRTAMRESLDQFIKNIEALEKKTPTNHELRKLFSAQDRSTKIHSLGSLIIEQYQILLSGAILQVYAYTDNRFTQLFYMNPALKTLSDAKSLIELKGSLYGTRYNNTHAPVPETMLEILSPFKPTENSATTSTQNELPWLSLRPYMDAPGDIQELDKILCHFSQRSSTAHTKINWYFGPLSLLASTLEFILAIPLRAAVSALSFAASCVGRIIRIATFGYLGYSTEKFDNKIAGIHHKYSLVRYVKNRAAQKFKRHNMEGEISYEHQVILDECQKHTRSLYNVIFTHYLSGDALAKIVETTLRRIASSITHPVFESTYILSTSSAKRKENYDKISARTAADMEKAFQHSFTQETDAAAGPLQESATIETNQLGAVITDPTIRAKIPKNSAEKEWPTIAKFHANTYSSPIDFFDEIAHGLSDLVVDPMFRKSPGAATLFFMLSQASWAVLLAPSLAASLGPAGKVLFTLPAWFSKHFTGAPVNETFVTKMVGVFLEWKGLFFTTELMLEAANGDFDFIEQLFGSSEKIVLGAVMLISLGYGMQFIPEINSSAAGILNFFSNEARHCAHATLPFSGIEYAFLGLKFSLLVHSLLSGTTTHPVEAAINCKAINEALKSENIFSQNLNAADVQQKIRGIFDQFAPADLDQNTKERSVQCLIRFAKRLKASSMTEVLEENAPSLTQTAPRPRSPELDAQLSPEYLQLQNAIEIVQQMEMVGTNFKSRKEALLFFDALSDRFDTYNNTLKAKGRFDKVIDKSEILHNFYNKHCYHGSNNLVRILSTIPLYPLTYAWRKLKSSLASTHYFHSPSIQHQVEKSFAKDKALAMQVLAFTSRVGHTIGRAYSYAFRVIAFVAITAATGTIILWKDSFRKAFYKTLAKISLHHSDLTEWVRPKYAEYARKADTSADGLLSQCGEALERLNQEARPQLASDNAAVTTANNALMTYYKDYQKRSGFNAFMTSSKRPKQMEQLSRIINNEKLPAAEKETKLTTILNQMNGNSKLKRCMAGRSTLFSVPPAPLAITNADPNHSSSSDAARP